MLRVVMTFDFDACFQLCYYFGGRDDENHAHEIHSSVFLVPAFFIFFWILNFCFYMKVGAQSDYIVLQIKLRRRHALNVN